MSEGLIDVRVKRISYEVDGINSYELVSAADRDLDPFTAGGHIDVHLPNGMVRSYSLVNDQRERHPAAAVLASDSCLCHTFNRHSLSSSIVELCHDNKLQR